MLSSVKAHTLNVKSLAVDPMEDFIISGSNEGSVKAWDLPTLTCREHWEDVHVKSIFVRKPGVFEAPVSTYGVMQVMLSSKYLFSCGSDGRILRTEILRPSTSFTTHSI
jgi:WD40 repeat protein